MATADLAVFDDLRAWVELQLDPAQQALAGIILAVVLSYAVWKLAEQLSRTGRSNARRWSTSGARSGSWGKPSYSRPGRVPMDSFNDRADPKWQMEAIALTEFETWPLLNSEEARVLPLLESCVRKLGLGHRVMAQTSLGEVIRPKGNRDSVTARNAYAAINSKRLDFAVVDRWGHLKLAIEYQGSGHYSATAFMRDAVKREAIRRSGAGWMEIEQGYRSDDVELRLIRALAPESLTARRPEGVRPPTATEGAPIQAGERP